MPFVTVSILSCTVKITNYEADLEQLYILTLTYAYYTLYVVDVDECRSNPCRNGGDCVDGINMYWCRCEDNWGGQRCEYSEYTINQSTWNNAEAHGEHKLGLRTRLFLITNSDLSSGFQTDRVS